MTTPVLDERPRATLEAAFARHETFHPRFGWLKKGYSAAVVLPDIFLRDDAPAQLGVGKNMVRAIRYWSLAYKVLSEKPNQERPRLRDAIPTDFAHALLKEDGWDPYLERTGSLWLLHWKLFGAPCMAPAWFIAFNHFPQIEFSDEDLFKTLRMFRDKTDSFQSIVDASLKKDVDCLTKMFAGGSSAGEVAEDSLDSPFVELDVLRRVPGSRHHYTFNLGPKLSLPDDVVVFACADHIRASEGASRVVNLSSLVHGPGSPGNIFKLTETSLFDALDRYSQKSELVSVDAAAGVRQLVLHREPEHVGERVLSMFYRQSDGWVV